MDPIILVDPERGGGKPLLETLQLRQTTRKIGPRELPLQVLSNILWAVFRVNREKASFGRPGRTAASASNSQGVGLYVALKDGLQYETAPHQLIPIADADFRTLSINRGTSKLTKDAPVNIFYVAGFSRYDLGPAPPDPLIGDLEVQKSYYYTDTGFIVQNVHLFAALEGLATWFHNCDRDRVRAEFDLRPTQRVLFAQTVGYPA